VRSSTQRGEQRGTALAHARHARLSQLHAPPASLRVSARGAASASAPQAVRPSTSPARAQANKSRQEGACAHGGRAFCCAFSTLAARAACASSTRRCVAGVMAAARDAARGGAQKCPPACAHRGRLACVIDARDACSLRWSGASSLPCTARAHTPLLHARGRHAPRVRRPGRS
jgi:hypothetical protein